MPVEDVEERSLAAIAPKDTITEEVDQIFLNAQMALLILAAILILCALFVLLIWYAQKNIAQKEREIQYQEELYEIFSAYLSSNSNDVYMLMDLERKRTEYVGPNVERVPDIPGEKISADVRSFAGVGGEGGKKPNADEVNTMKLGATLEPITTTWVSPG